MSIVWGKLDDAAVSFLAKLGAKFLEWQKGDRLAKALIVFLLSYLGLVATFVYVWGRMHR
jgi:hypothetical protein